MHECLSMHKKAVPLTRAPTCKLPNKPAIIRPCIHVRSGRLPTPENPMKKNFPLQAQGKHPDRVLEAVKHDIRKYFKRERNRDVPKGVDFWDFDCKVGLSAETAEVVRVSAVIEAVDAAAKTGAPSVYVEILSKHGTRVLKAQVEDGDDQPNIHSRESGH